MGENILVGSGGMSPSQVEGTWMASAPHRANILLAAYNIGRDRLRARLDGRLWIVQDFGALSEARLDARKPCAPRASAGRWPPNRGRAGQRREPRIVVAGAALAIGLLPVAAVVLWFAGRDYLRCRTPRASR